MKLNDVVDMIRGKPEYGRAFGGRARQRLGQENLSNSRAKRWP